MSEPLKKPGHQPESYDPRTPEIVSMVEQAQGNARPGKVYKVKTENGGAYISGIPRLKWGQWQDCTYSGAMALIFDAMGVKTSYEQLMGLSGACYQAIMNEGWGPDTKMPQVGVNCEHNAPLALGIKAYSLKNEKKRDARVMKNLDNGFPNLVCGQRHVPLWTVLTGYEKTDAGVKFFGRSYCDNQGAREDEIFTDNQYHLADRYPGDCPHALLRFYDQKRKPLPPRMALKISLETCIKTFDPAQAVYKKCEGYDAYDIFIAGFELSDEEYRAKCQGGHYHVGCLMDARRAAYIYLRESATLLTGENRARLMQASAIYQAMLNNMLAAVPYETLDLNGNEKIMLNAEQRQALAKALRKNKGLEKEVRMIVADILRHWRDRK